MSSNKSLLPEILPNCGMVAGATAAGISVEQFTAKFKAMFKKGPNWKGRCTLTALVGLLKELQVKTKLETVERCNLKNFVERQTGAGVGYILRTGGHFQFVRNGMVTDQFETMPVGQFHRNRKIVTHALRII